MIRLWLLGAAGWQVWLTVDKCLLAGAESERAHWQNQGRITFLEFESLNIFKSLTVHEGFQTPEEVM